MNATTNTIYVANSQSNNLSVIDGATNSVTATIPVGTSPSGVAVESQTNFIYVANAGNSQSGNPGNVTVINGTTNATANAVGPECKESCCRSGELCHEQDLRGEFRQQQRHRD